MKHENDLTDKQIALATASILLEIDAVKFNVGKPFTLASGLKSPTYIDCRKIISHPKERNRIMDFICKRVKNLEQFDVIAGGETAGIPFGTLLADRLDKPLIYVRKKPKGYGRNAQIEGVIKPKQHVVLIEDLSTNGESKVSFVQAIRATGAICNHAVVIFCYGISSGTENILTQHNINLHYLATWQDILEVATVKKTINSSTFNSVESFLKNPLAWSENH